MPHVVMLSVVMLRVMAPSLLQEIFYYVCVLLFFLRLLRRKNAKQSSTALSADLLTHNQGTKCRIKVVNTAEFTHAFSGSKNVWLYVNCTNYE
jgi:hypothetical protein